MKKICLLTSLGVFLICSGLNGQHQHSLYHYQRTSLFELLPTSKNDIIFIGNSITNGCEWVEIFGNKNVKNRGINGDQSLDVLRSMETIVKGQPKKIFLMIGVNDLAHGKTPDSILSNVREIIELITEKSPKTKIYIQNVIPVNEIVSGHSGGHFSKNPDIVSLNKLYENLCREKGVTYIDVWSAMVDENGRLKAEYSNDGLHLMGEGYIVWSNIIRPYIK